MRFVGENKISNTPKIDKTVRNFTQELSFGRRRTGKMNISNTRFLYLVILALIMGISCSKSQREAKPDQMQIRGDGFVYVVNGEEPYTGKVIDFYESGQKRKEDTFKDGRLHGLTTDWYSNGQKKSEVSYEKEEKSGPYRTWYENGQKQEEGSYKAGMIDGPYRKWNEYGQKQEEGFYKAGMLDGQFRTWYENGQQQQERAYKSGKLDGQWILWNKYGAKVKECTYKNGKLEGHCVLWYDNGKKRGEVTYKDGKIKGKPSFWKQNGDEFVVGVMTDFDGNTYLTKKYGNQWWMAENLKVTHYRNGDPIPNVTEGGWWLWLSTGAYCNNDNDEGNVNDYGRLYNWYAVDDIRNIAPDGWHVPSDNEWQILYDYLDGKENTWEKMDEYSFFRIFSGFRGSSGFEHMYEMACFWSSTESSSDNACTWLIIKSGYLSSLNDSKRCGFSVRCVKD